MKVTKMIAEMIDKVLEEGHKPKEIHISIEFYDRLIEETKSYEESGYKVETFGVVFVPEKVPKYIREYLGIPLIYDSNYDSDLVITWI